MGRICFSKYSAPCFVGCGSGAFGGAAALGNAAKSEMRRAVPHEVLTILRLPAPTPTRQPLQPSRITQKSGFLAAEIREALFRFYQSRTKPAGLPDRASTACSPVIPTWARFSAAS